MTPKLVRQETPLVRVCKDTQKTAQTDARAAALMQKVYAAASTGTFDPADPDSWPQDVVACLDQAIPLNCWAARMHAR